ncbi:MAG: SdpI family protein [Nitrososphaerales archaeon]
MKIVVAMSIGLLVASFLISIFTYPYMPELMPSHWNAAGEVDGYLPKFWGAFLIPLIMVGLYLLFVAIPRIDPLKDNIMRFISYYYGFILVMLLFMLVVQTQVILWGLGFKVSPNVIIPLGIGALFIYIGVLLGKAKRNWFIGIRTPWTLSSDVVWDKTHRIGGRLFIAVGLLSLVGVLLPEYAYLFILAPILAVSIYTVVYSYIAYQRDVKKID